MILAWWDYFAQLENESSWMELKLHASASASDTFAALANFLARNFQMARKSLA